MAYDCVCLATAYRNIVKIYMMVETETQLACYRAFDPLVSLANERHERVKHDTQCRPTYQCWIMPLNFLSVEWTECRTHEIVCPKFRPCKVCLIDTRPRTYCYIHTIDERRILVESGFESHAINRRISRDGEVSVSRWIIRNNHDGNCDSGIIVYVSIIQWIIIVNLLRITMHIHFLL